MNTGSHARGSARRRRTDWDKSKNLIIFWAAQLRCVATVVSIVDTMASPAQALGSKRWETDGWRWAEQTRVEEGLSADSSKLAVRSSGRMRKREREEDLDLSGGRTAPIKGSTKVLFTLRIAFN